MAEGILFGGGAGLIVQAIIFWTMLRRATPKTLGVAYGAGMLIRFASLGLMAFLVVPALAMPAAATLLSMVACFFVTTLMEAVFLKRRFAGEQVVGAKTIQTGL